MSFPELVGGPAEMDPGALNLDVGFIHAPGAVCRSLPSARVGGNLWELLGDPAIKRRMVYLYAALSSKSRYDTG